MIGCLRTRVRKQPIVTLYFEFETVLKFFNLEAWPLGLKLKKKSTKGVNFIKSKMYTIWLVYSSVTILR